MRCWRGTGGEGGEGEEVKCQMSKSPSGLPRQMRPVDFPFPFAFSSRVDGNTRGRGETAC